MTTCANPEAPRGKLHLDLPDPLPLSAVDIPRANAGAIRFEDRADASILAGRAGAAKAKLIAEHPVGDVRLYPGDVGNAPSLERLRSLDDQFVDPRLRRLPKQQQEIIRAKLVAEFGRSTVGELFEVSGKRIASTPLNQINQSAALEGNWKSGSVTSNEKPAVRWYQRAYAYGGSDWN